MPAIHGSPGAVPVLSTPPSDPDHDSTQHALGAARALDDDSVPDTGIAGAGLPAIADIGCAEALPGCVGDLNGDLWVNAADFTVLAANFGLAGAQPWQGDINRDTLVNAGDFTILAAQFGAQCP